MLLFKYDSSGNYKWTIQNGGNTINNNSYSEDFVHGITTDNANNIFITGSFNDTSYFGSDTLIIGTGQREGFIAKFDELGNLIWINQSVGNYWFTINSVVTDDSNNVYITGSFKGDSYFKNAVNQQLHSLHPTMFVAKFDQYGSLKWINQTTGKHIEGTSLTIDKENNTYILGNFYDTAYFYNDTLIGPITFPPHYNDIYIVKYDSAGNYKWVVRSVNTSTGEIYEAGIACSFNNKIYCAGYFNNSYSFGNHTLVSSGNFDCFIAKLTEGPNSITKHTLDTKILLYPNPSAEYVTIKYERIYKTAQYSIIDIMGKVVKSGKLKPGSSHRLGIKQLTNGLYFINITDGEYVFNVKFIKQD